VKPILAVGLSVEDRGALRSILNAHGWEVREAAGWGQVCQRLGSSSYSAVICERSLVDGNWKDVLVEVEDCYPSPPLIVASRHADERLWSEVLGSGGYDVLATPFQEAEVLHLLGCQYGAEGGAQRAALGQPHNRREALLG
jgi:DNA-binding NtrC family response regulator